MAENRKRAGSSPDSEVGTRGGIPRRLDGNGGNGGNAPERPPVHPGRRRMALWIAGVAGMAALGSAPSARAKDTATATGEVRRIDAERGTVAIRHGEIQEMGLPEATLVYQIAIVLLRDIKPGDKVRFTVTRQDGKYVVIEISKSMLP